MSNTGLDRSHSNTLYNCSEAGFITARRVVVKVGGGGLNAAVTAEEWGHAELEHFQACERNANTESQPTGLLF